MVIGVRADGTKELVALEDGYRESEESWASVLRDLRGLGLRAAAMAIGRAGSGSCLHLFGSAPATGGLDSQEDK